MNDIDVDRLSSELRRYRRVHDLSLDELVEPGLSKSTLNRVEMIVGYPHAEVLAKIARLLNKPLATFVTANRGKVVHYEDAPLIERISAVLYADDTISDAARNVLLDLLTVAMTEAAHA